MARFIHSLPLPRQCRQQQRKNDQQLQSPTAPFMGVFIWCVQELWTPKFYYHLLPSTCLVFSVPGAEWSTEHPGWPSRGRFSCLGRCWVTCQCPASPKKRRFGLMLGGTSFKHVQTCPSYYILYLILQWWVKISCLTHTSILLSISNLLHIRALHSRCWARLQWWPGPSVFHWRQTSHDCAATSNSDLPEIWRICIQSASHLMSEGLFRHQIDFWVTATLYALFKDLPIVTMRRSWDKNEALMLQGPWWGPSAKWSQQNRPLAALGMPQLQKMSRLWRRD